MQNYIRCTGDGSIIQFITEGLYVFTEAVVSDSCFLLFSFMNV